MSNFAFDIGNPKEFFVITGNRHGVSVGFNQVKLCFAGLGIVQCKGGVRVGRARDIVLRQER